jgi:hypothetical protein
MVEQMNPIRYALIISALLAAGAFYPDHSYNYFVLLKWVLFATSIWAVVIEREKKRIFSVAVFCALALIHNPIMKFHFERDVWLVIDGMSAVWMIHRSLSMGWMIEPNQKQ